MGAATQVLRAAAALFVGLAAGRAAAQAAPAAPEWPALLTAHPALPAGDRDAAAADWVAALAAAPADPLAPAALALLEAVQPDVADPPALRAALLALDAATFPPTARARLLRLQGAARAAGPEAAALGQDCHADVLASWFVLGPLGPAQDPLALAIPPDLLADPRLERSHAALAGDQAWRDLPRSPLAARIDPAGAADVGAGWLLLAAPFDAPGGGPAWIELDLVGSDETPPPRPDALWSFGGSSFPGWVLGENVQRLPGFAVGLAGGEQRVVDLTRGEHGARHLEPVVLRDGRNVLLLRVPAGAQLRPLVRVLAADGAPRADLRPAGRSGVPGAPTDQAPPSVRPPDLAGALLARTGATAHEVALAALLLALDRRPELVPTLLDRAVSMPGGHELLPLAAALLGPMAHLPNAWRRTQVRQAVERGLTHAPGHLALGLAEAQRLLSEDRHEEAVGQLVALGQQHPGQPWSLLELSRAYLALEMVAQAEAALAEAEVRAPRCPALLEARLARERSAGRAREAAAIQARLVEAAGRGAARVHGLSRALLDLGELDAGLALLDEAVLRGPTRARRTTRAAELMGRGRPEAARVELQALVAEDPAWPDPQLGLADLACLTGDRAAELASLRAALALRPGLRPARERLADLTGDDEDLDFRARFGRDTTSLVTADVMRSSDESVVRLLDEALVRVFADGSVETVTHELVRLRDLAATAERGTLQIPGETLAAATIKADGTRYEPVAVGGEYVLPNLEPGDLVELAHRQFTAPPPTGVLRLGSWFFRSLDEPFVVSRYVVALPPGLDLRVESRHFAGTHEIHDWRGQTVHVFEEVDQPRVQPEVDAPPGTWFLPWIELGQDADPRAELHRMQLTWLPHLRLTPELVRAAESATAGAAGQEAQARELHAFVAEHLTQRSTFPSPAHGALLAREGNPALLYAALLAAAGVRAELVLSRGIAPSVDPDPRPAFVEPGRLQRRLLVVVQPDDGPQAWCDLAPRGMPYGALLGDAPGAPAVELSSGRALVEPAHPPAGSSLHLVASLGPDGAARVSGSLTLDGAVGQLYRVQLAELPDAFHQGVVQNTAAGLVPDLDLLEHELAGLAPGEQPRMEFAGRVERFLDAEGSRAFPLPPLQLAAALAVEGQRRLPFLSADRSVERAEAVIELPEGLDLAELPPPVELEAGGWRYRLHVGRSSDGRVVVERVMERQPFQVPAAGYAELTDFATRVDQAERARLRFVALGAGG